LFDKYNLQESYFKIHDKFYIEVGDYLNQPEAFSILSSKESIRNQRIAYYANKYDSVIGQSIFTNGITYNITSLTFNDIYEKWRRGDKVTNFYFLQEWIMGGGYYHGKHIYHLTTNSYFSLYIPRIINQYNIKYIVDSNIAKEKFKFFDSISPIKDKVYSSPKIELYHLERGLI